MSETYDDRTVPNPNGGGSVAGPSAASAGWELPENKQPSRIHKRKPRKPISCAPCRKSKLKCDRQLPCATCKRRECLELCTYTRPASSAQPASGPARSNNPLDHAAQGPIAPLISPPQASIDGLYQANQQDDTHTEWEALLQRPMDQMSLPASRPHNLCASPGNFCFPFSFGPAVSREEILATLPPAPYCDYLVTEYFIRLSPLFHILHGPTFQKQYNAFRQDPNAADLSWIALLFAMCSATINTFDNDESMSIDIWQDAPASGELASVACRLRTAAMICLTKDQFLIRHTLNTLEALLLLIYTISNHEGAERAWTLLGLTLNIGIALRCNIECEPHQLNCIEVQRRRRCWAGILLLHTYQATFFQDIDMSALLNIDAIMPVDANDSDIQATAVFSPSSQPTQMSVMRFKIQMFQLSSRICRHLSGGSKYDEAILSAFDGQVAEQQRQWDTVFLLDGSPRLLDPSSYAHWCIMQLYAHQLYLLLHRPFCKPHGQCFRSASRAKCIGSGTALLDVHRQLWELPRLRHYRWLLSGLTSFYAIHGAIALASCLLDESETVDPSPYRGSFDAAVARIEKLQPRSQICSKAYPILSHLQTLLSVERPRNSFLDDHDFGTTFDEWIDGIQWMNPDSINWKFWDNILNVDL